MQVFLGQVCQANVGQSPARQASLGAGKNLKEKILKLIIFPY
jgi:hypothetical protein